MKAGILVAMLVLALTHRSLGQSSIETLTNGDVQITTPSIAAQEYFLERSSDLGEWQRLGNIFPGTGSTLIWNEPETNASAFYRVSISPLIPQPLFGIDFSPYLDGQSPETNVQVPRGQIEDRMRLLIPRTTWIRTYSMVDGLQVAGAVAHQFGLKAALGAWLGPETTPEGILANQENISNLITAARAGQADLLIVGSEVLQRGDLPVSNLVAYINEVHAAAPGIPITAADTYAMWISPSNAQLIEACDVLMVNFYPFWQGAPIDYAVTSLFQDYLNVEWNAGNKPVWVSETGWPSEGSSEMEAVPSPDNAAQYFSEFVSWARAGAVPFFYFEAYDEAWKVDEGDVGPHWGIWQTNAMIKSGMESIFDNTFFPQGWDAMIGGPGTPGISFTSIPSIGSVLNVSGTVSHVAPFDVFICLYIQVAGAWFQKPFGNAPYITAAPDGSWTSEYATGGNDINATNFTAYLFPTNYLPPFVSNQQNLPSELAGNALALASASR